jgi:hypothetical protein
MAVPNDLVERGLALAERAFPPPALPPEERR